MNVESSMHVGCPGGRACESRWCQPKPSFGVGYVPLGDGFLKDGVKNVGAVAALLQLFIEIAKRFLAVIGVG